MESSRGIHQYIGDFNFTKFLALFSRVFRGKNARKHVNFTENIEERFHEILEERKEKKPLEAVEEIKADQFKEHTDYWANAHVADPVDVLEAVFVFLTKGSTMPTVDVSKTINPTRGGGI